MFIIKVFNSQNCEWKSINQIPYRFIETAFENLRYLEETYPNKMYEIFKVG